MEEVHKELEEVKAEKERLRKELMTKTELSESLKKVQSEHILKLKEANLQIEKQAQDLNAKSEEISEMRQFLGNLTSGLQEKESSLRRLRSTNEKLRADSDENLHKLEGEKKELGLALDGAMERNKELEQELRVRNDEIVGLKRLLRVSESKLAEAKGNVQVQRELSLRDDLIVKLEEDYRKVQDHLKWKTEKFEYLEEAYKSLQDRFQSSRDEWQRERTSLLDEICLLQERLDSQTRMSDNLKMQLEICNQALAHEESRRKILEGQVSEPNSHFQSVSFQSEKLSKVDNLMFHRDDEIASLRNTLGKKETISKESEFKVAQLEQENVELRESLKELQEAQIRSAGGCNSSLTNLRNKLRKLEQVHGNCSKRDSELSCKIEEMKGDIDGYKSKLIDKEKILQELHMELENCYCRIYASSEEIALLLMVLKLEMSEAFQKLLTEKVELDLCNKQKDDEISSMKKLLEMKNPAVEKTDTYIYSETENELTLKRDTEKLVHIFEDQKKITNNLQQKVALLENTVALKTEAIEALSKDKENITLILDEKNGHIRNLQENIAWLKQEFVTGGTETAFLASLDTEKALMQEKDGILELMKNQKQSISHLNELKQKLELDLENVLISSLSEVIEKQIEVRAIFEAFRNSEHMRMLEVEERNIRLVQLQNEASGLRQNLQSLEESLFLSNQQSELLQTTSKAKNMETEEAINQLQNEKRSLQGLNKKLEFERCALHHDNMLLSSKLKVVVADFEAISGRISEVSCGAMKLMDSLNIILQHSSEEVVSTANGPEGNEDFFDSVRDKADTSFASPAVVETKRGCDERLPLKELNHHQFQ